LFGMGRDNVLPRRLFGHIDAVHRVPTYNIWLIGIFAFAGALWLDFERAAELLNFGAFIAFMGVNTVSFKHFFLTPPEGYRRRFIRDAVIPVAGLIFCFWIWWSLPRPAKIVGGICFIVGIVYDAVLTKGFKTQPSAISFEA